MFEKWPWRVCIITLVVKACMIDVIDKVTQWTLVPLMLHRDKLVLRLAGTTP